jgi:hypothetical protein
MEVGVDGWRGFNQIERGVSRIYKEASKRPNLSMLYRKSTLLCFIEVVFLM